MCLILGQTITISPMLASAHVVSQCPHNHPRRWGMIVIIINNNTISSSNNNIIIIIILFGLDDETEA